jgi:hypothetical protein
MYIPVTPTSSSLVFPTAALLPFSLLLQLSPHLPTTTHQQTPRHYGTSIFDERCSIVLPSVRVRYQVIYQNFTDLLLSIHHYPPSHFPTTTPSHPFLENQQGIRTYITSTIPLHIQLTVLLRHTLSNSPSARD